MFYCQCRHCHYQKNVFIKAAKLCREQHIIIIADGELTTTWNAVDKLTGGTYVAHKDNYDHSNN